MVPKGIFRTPAGCRQAPHYTECWLWGIWHEVTSHVTFPRDTNQRDTKQLYKTPHPKPFFDLTHSNTSDVPHPFGVTPIQLPRAVYRYVSSGHVTFLHFAIYAPTPFLYERAFPANYDYGMDRAYPATTSRLRVRGCATVPQSVLYGACGGNLTPFGCDDGGLHERRHLGRRHRWGRRCAVHQPPWTSQFRVSYKPAGPRRQPRPYGRLRRADNFGVVNFSGLLAV